MSNGVTDKKRSEEIKLIKIINKLPPEHISIILDFAEFINKKYLDADSIQYRDLEADAVSDSKETLPVENIYDEKKMKPKSGIEQSTITRRINEVCDNVDTTLNPQFREAAKRVLTETVW